MSEQTNEDLYQVRNLGKKYGERWVLDIDHLDILPGEVLAIVGPSGSGKSTLLRMLNFLETPSRGEIRFFDHSYCAEQEMPLEIRRRVTAVFQRPVLLDRNVYDNVTFGLRIRNQKNSHSQIEAILKEVGVYELAKQPARTLSGGEAQRVALARAMILEPDVLLLDEPTANLDPYNVNLIENIVRKRNNDMGMAMVLVTHNVFQAHRIAHRVLFLLDGKVVEIAMTDKFFESPSDPRTKAFVRGEMVY